MATLGSPKTPVADLEQKFQSASLTFSEPTEPVAVPLPSVSVAQQQASRLGIAILPSGTVALPKSQDEMSPAKRASLGGALGAGRYGEVSGVRLRPAGSSPAAGTHRSVTAADIASGGALDLTEPTLADTVSVSISASVQANLSERFGFKALQLPSLADGSIGRSIVLASPGWATADVIVVVLAAPGSGGRDDGSLPQISIDGSTAVGAPPGLWSVATAVRHGLQAGSVLPLVEQLFAPVSPASPKPSAVSASAPASSSSPDKAQQQQSKQKSPNKTHAQHQHKAHKHHNSGSSSSSPSAAPSSPKAAHASSASPAASASASAGGGAAARRRRIAMVIADSSSPFFSGHVSAQLFEYLLASRAQPRAELVWITHGSAAAEAVLQLLGEATARGTLARMRTAAVSLLAPVGWLSEATVTAIASSTLLRTILQLRTMVWLPMVAPPPVGADGTTISPPKDPLLVHLSQSMPGNDVSPFMSVSASIALPLTSAPNETAAQAAAAAALPSLVSPAVAAFIAHMASGGGNNSSANFMVPTPVPRMPSTLSTSSAASAKSAGGGGNTAVAAKISPRDAPSSSSSVTSPSASAAGLEVSMNGSGSSPLRPAALAIGRDSSSTGLSAAATEPTNSPKPSVDATSSSAAGAAAAAAPPSPSAAVATLPSPTASSSLAAPSASASLSPSSATGGGFVPWPPVPPPFSSVADEALRRLRALHSDSGSWKAAGVSGGVVSYTYNSGTSGVPLASSPPAGVASSAAAGGGGGGGGEGGGDGLVGARGDALLPFPPSALLQLLVEESDVSRHELDAQLDAVTPLRELSPQARVERMAMKGVFPTDPRDFIVLSCWRAEEDGSVAIFATSVDAAISSPSSAVDASLRKAAAPVKKYVRGTLDIGGWVITPVASKEEYERLCGEAGSGGGAGSGKGYGQQAWRGGSRVSYLFRTSIGGNIPKMIVKTVTASQAALPALVAKALEARMAKPGGSPLKKRMAAMTSPAEPVRNVTVAGAPLESTALVVADSAAVLASAPPPAARPDSESEPLLAESSSSGAGGASSIDGSALVADPAATSGSSSGDAASSVPASDAPSTSASASAPPPSAPSLPSFDISGVWKLDRGRSDSVQPMLQSMGIGLLLRKMIDGLEIVTTIGVGSAAVSASTPSSSSSSDGPSSGEVPVAVVPTVTMEDSSRFGKASNTLICDWAPHELRGGDGKVAPYRAIVLEGVDGVPEASVSGAAYDGFVAAYRRDGPPPLGPQQQQRPLYGPGSGCLLNETTLPDGLGMTREERHLQDPRTLRLVTVYIRDGVVKNRLVRYLARQDDVPARLLAKPQPTVAATKKKAASPVKTPAAPAAATASSSPVPASVGGAMLGPDGEPTPEYLAQCIEALLPQADVMMTTSSSGGGPGTPARPSVAVSPTKGSAVASSTGGAAWPWSPSKWLPDEVAVTQGCGQCGRPFTAAQRVHHCRHCGGAFCNDHSRARLPPAHLSKKELTSAGLAPDVPVRTCDKCALPVVSHVTSVPSSGGRVMVRGGNLGTAARIADGRTTVRLLDSDGADFSASNGSNSSGGGVDGSLSSGGGSGDGDASSGSISSGPSSSPFLQCRMEKPHTALSFIAPPGGVLKHRAVILTVEGRSTVFRFNYDPPSSIDVDASGPIAAGPCPTEGGLVVLRGLNMGDQAALEAGRVSVTLRRRRAAAAAGAASDVIESVPLRVVRVLEPHRALLVRLPPGSGGADSNILLVSVGDQAAAKPVPFSYAKPVVYAVRQTMEPKAVAVASVRSAGVASASTDPSPPSSSSTSSSSSSSSTDANDAAAAAAFDGETVLYVSGENFGSSSVGCCVCVTVRGVAVQPEAVTTVLPHAKLRVVLPPALAASSDAANNPIQPGEVAVRFRLTQLQQQR